jgi:hypothetical protein
MEFSPKKWQVCHMDCCLVSSMSAQSFGEDVF